MIIHQVEQRSVDWMILRAGKPTASEFHNLLTPEFKIRTGETPKTYLAKKVTEGWLGGPLAGFNSYDCEQGNILENEAKPWYSLEFGEEIQNVGFITTDDGKIGCSPDGLIGEDGGVEIKCPSPEKHCQYLLNGVVPDDYTVQVHGSMFVTGRKWWKFLSYRRHFPALLLTVERDEEAQEMIAEALEQFLGRFDRAMERLTELNGGPPKRTAPTQRAEYVPNMDDVPTP